MKLSTAAIFGLVLSGTSLAKIVTEYSTDGSISRIKLTLDDPSVLKKVRRTNSGNNCNQDNCYRALDGRLAAASSFCPTFTAQVLTATTSLGPFQTFCANNPSRVSSACSCLVPGTVTTTTSTVSVPPALPNNCHQDNCYRAVDGRLPIANTFCPTFTAEVVTATTSLGPFETFCANDPGRISSACSCLIAPAPTTSTTSTTTSAPPAPTCAAPGGHCTVNTFIQDCCHAPDGSVGCYFPTGDPQNGICFM